MLVKSKFVSELAVANRSGAMEFRDHLNEASPKSQTSRGNFFRKVCFALLTTIAIFTSCDWIEELEERDINVINVSLDKTTLTLEIGETETLKETIEPANATNKDVTWISSGSAVTVANGLVTAVSAGTATITVTTKDRNKIATCVVTVNPVDPNKKFLGKYVGLNHTYSYIELLEDNKFKQQYNMCEGWYENAGTFSINGNNLKLNAEWFLLAQGTVTLVIEGNTITDPNWVIDCGDNTFRKYD